MGSNLTNLDLCLEKLKTGTVLKTLYAVCIEEKCKRELESGRASPTQNFAGCEHCVARGDSLLASSTMLVRVKSVAYAIGFCPYAARLIELYGVQRVPLSTIPGKGSLVHRILAVVAPRVLRDIVESGRCVDVESAVRYAKEAVEAAQDEIYHDDRILLLDSLPEDCRTVIMKLQGENVDNLNEYERELLLGSCCRDIAEALGLERVPSTLEECIELAATAQEALAREEVIKQSVEISSAILANAAKYLCHYVRLAGWNSVIALAEYTLYDYNYRLIGVPDLILVEPERREAIVFEWKSMSPKESRVTVQTWEKIQTLLYAVLVANLLGYDTSDMETLSKILTSKITPVLCHHKKCILITRSSADSPPMLAFAQSGFYTRNMKLLEGAHIRGILALAKLAAEYLTMLAIAPYDKECLISFGEGENKIVSTVYRLMPDELRDNKLREQLQLAKVPSKPAREDNRLCAQLCREVLKLYNACKFYMIEIHKLARQDEHLKSVKDRFYATMRRLISKHEEVYAPLYALYHVHAAEMMEVLKRLRGRNPLAIFYHAGQGRPAIHWLDQVANRNPNMIVIDQGGHQKTYRFQIFKRLTVAMLDTHGLVKLEHALLPTMWSERGVNGERKLHLAMPRRDRSIHVTFISPLHVSFDTPLAAGLSVFLRSTEVEYGDRLENAYIQLVVPSPSLLFSFKTFVNNLQRIAEWAGDYISVEKRGDIVSYECKDSCFFIAFESDVDLTYLSRSVLDKMLRLYVLMRSEDTEVDEVVESLGDKLGFLLGTLLTS